MSMHMIYGVREPKSKIKVKKKPGWQQAEAEYKAWLAKHGVDGTKKKRKEIAPYQPPKVVLPRATSEYKSLVTKPDMHACAKQSDNKMEHLSGSYTIGQAYNKGNLQVLTPSECKDSATGKRRG